MKTTTVGTCVVCEREIAVRESHGYGKENGLPVLVHHGYRRPGDGEIHGDCFAVGMEPHELSTAAAKAYRKDRVAALAHEREFLRKLEANEVDVLYREELVPVPTTAERSYRSIRLSPLHAQGDPGWMQWLVPYRRDETELRRQEVFRELHQGSIVRKKVRIEYCEREIARMDRAIETWTPKELRERVEVPPKTTRRRRWMR